jgi:hypothetical protein
MKSLSGFSNHLRFIKSKNDLTSFLTLLSHFNIHIISSYEKISVTPIICRKVLLKSWSIHTCENKVG